MKISRWPALVILAGLVAAAWIVDRDHDRDPATAETADTPLEAQGFLPVAPPADALSSTWYCAGGTSDQDGDADTTVVVANATDGELSGTATIFPAIPSQVVVATDDPAAIDDAQADADPAPADTEEGDDELTPLPVTIDVTVPAGARTEIRLGDEVAAPHAAALVELPGGTVTVEQRVEGPNGADVSPCTTQASPTWYFAAGRTTADAAETLAFFNPFPDPAVIDVTFRTEDDLRTPVEFEGYAVPGQTLVVEDIGRLVTRREHVSISVEARSGRLVVNRVLDLNGSEGPQGLEVAAGAAQPALSWYFPDGTVTEGVEETFVVYNPTDTVAEVDLVVEPEDADRFGAIEPFSLSIPPEAFQEVAVQDEERIGAALEAAGGPEVLDHATRVVSVNDVPVVVEQEMSGSESSARPGYDLVFGSPLLMERAILSGVDAEAVVTIMNPSGSRPVSVTVGGAAVEVPVAGRLALTGADIGADSPLLVEADGPVVIERRLVLGDPSDTSAQIAVPLAGSVSEPPSPFG